MSEKRPTCDGQIEFWKRQLPNLEINVACETKCKAKALRESSLIIFQDPEGISLRAWRLLKKAQPNKKLITISHGLTFKGKTKSTSAAGVWSEQGLQIEGSSSGGLWDTLIAQGAVHAYMSAALAVAKDERKRRGDAPKAVLPLGFPKFIRCAELSDGSAEAVIFSEQTRQFFNAQPRSSIFLYAPTRGDVLETMGHNAWKCMQESLEELDSYLLLRRHPLVQKTLSNIESPRIVDFPRDDFLSTVDLVALVGCILTDRSSIASLGLALNTPVIFLDTVAESRFQLPPQLARPGPLVGTCAALHTAMAEARSAMNDNSWLVKHGYAFHRSLWELDRTNHSRESWLHFLQSD